MIDIFGSQLISSISCLRCSHINQRFDSVLDLNIEVPKVDRYETLSLETCIKSYTMPEDLEKTGYKCEKCKSPHIEKSMHLYSLPHVLVILLKRFTISAKIDQKIDIPLHLDPQIFFHSTYASHGSYELYGISHHHGTKNGGHYIAEV